ncbi:MAG: lytic transglycosylase domain-containing protein [Parvularculaceae bacterium]
MMRLLVVFAAVGWSVFAGGNPAGAQSLQAEPVTASAPDPQFETDPLKILSEADAALYAEIFTLQEDGRWNAADKKIAQIENDILMGYVLYQRYMHPTDYRSRYDELKRWMAYYADHPDANKIYRLALRRRPKGANAPVRPVSRKWRSTPDSELHPDLQADYKNTSKPRVRQIEGRVRYLTHHRRAIEALRYIDSPRQRRAITDRQYDRMRSWIAASLYYQGYVDTAKRLAAEAADRNGDAAVYARWIAGLIAFREKNLSAAHDYFAAMAAVPYQEDSLRAAAGFWAARAALADGHVDDVTPNLEIAAAFPFTFYGQLALAQLGRDYDYEWTPPELTQESWANLAEAEPRVRRAAALAQVGLDSEADLELRWANGFVPEGLDKDLLAVAAALGLPAAQVDIALSGKAKYLEPGLFPIPHYAPAEGFKTDRALLYALMRQESKFKVEATSRVGARGLMQLMPRTASFVAKDRSLYRASGRNRLYDPALNLEIGQTYVNYLIETAAEGDLFDMAVAYNGGPGNLRRWKRKMEIDDPLLFIESIPNPESRDFVELVLTNFWIYRARLGQPAPTRDKVAAGELPLYEALDRIAGASNQAP